MDKDMVMKLINEVTDEVFTKNRHILDGEGVFTVTIETAVQLSALTTIKILEKLELIEKG